MKDLNKLVLIGRITKDCTFAYLNSGSAKADFSIAVNDTKKEGEKWVDETSFFNITVWGKTAENLKPYLTKGRQVAVEGRIKQDRWEKDGQKFSAIKIITENIQLLSAGNNQGNNNTIQNNNVNYESESGFPENVPF